MRTPRTYPEGVSCWVDIEVDDVAEAARFYGALFDWTFIEAASKPRYSSPSTTASAETDWTRDAQIRDPQGAEFTVRQYRPPD